MNVAVKLDSMRQSARILALVFAAVALMEPVRSEAMSLLFAAKIICTEKSVKVQLKSASSTITTVLPIPTSRLRSGKLRGCAAIANLEKPPTSVVSTSSLKGLKSAYVISISLPAQENGLDFNLSYDWFVLQKKNGSWISGPLAQTRGLETSVENRVKLASASKVELVQTSGANGETSEQKAVFVKSGASWVKN